VLTCSAIYVTASIVLPLEVAPSVVQVEELTRSLSGNSVVERVTVELELEVSEVLGMSLSKVCARYFGDSDVGEDLVEERNYRDRIENHSWSGRYFTKDIDGVPFSMYNTND
jgi:hypothetical protein